MFREADPISQAPRADIYLLCSVRRTHMFLVLRDGPLFLMFPHEGNIVSYVLQVRSLRTRLLCWYSLAPEVLTPSSMYRLPRTPSSRQLLVWLTHLFLDVSR